MRSLVVNDETNLLRLITPWLDNNCQIKSKHATTTFSQFFSELNTPHETQGAWCMHTSGRMPTSGCMAHAHYGDRCLLCTYPGVLASPYLHVLSYLWGPHFRILCMHLCRLFTCEHAGALFNVDRWRLSWDMRACMSG